MLLARQPCNTRQFAIVDRGDVRQIEESAITTWPIERRSFSDGGSYMVPTGSAANVTAAGPGIGRASAGILARRGAPGSNTGAAAAPGAGG